VIERHVVLVAPEVHWNTGNIGRTCLGAGAWLHLVKPLGFSLDSRQVKRAGLDYWPRVKLKVHEDFENFLLRMEPEKEEMAVFSKSGNTSFWHLPHKNRLFLVFGSESKGLPEDLLARYGNSTYHIPIANDIRSLNLSTAAGIALYESLRPFSTALSP
jgi:tRNA (cytidine/uridine-2'-O-)-methyltransferase